MRAVILLALTATPAWAQEEEPQMNEIQYDPVTGLIGFETATTTPLGSLDLLAIAPFLLAAMIAALVRKLRKNQE